MAATKRMVNSASDGQRSSGGKGKESQWDEDTKHQRFNGVQIHALGTPGKASVQLFFRLCKSFGQKQPNPQVHRSQVI